MEQSLTVMWICLLTVGLTLALPPAFSLTTYQADLRPPRLISCVFLNRANITCRWEAVDIPTTHYTLQVHLVYRSMNRYVKTFTCTTSDTSCTAPFEGVSVRNSFCTTVTAHGHSWSMSSQPRCQSGRTEVMLPPVTLNSVRSVTGRPLCLTVTWSYVLDHFPLADSEIKAGDLKSQIEFTAQGQVDVQVENVVVADSSFLVCLFRPDTLYSVRLRHHYRGPDSPWSLWSNVQQGRTVEDAPSAAPAFWRQVKGKDTNSWRLVSLLWKPLPHFLANGRVLFFSVTCQTEIAQVLNDHMSCRDLSHTSTSCSLLLPSGRCSCALTASTSAGRSPETRIFLRGASEREPPPPSQITVSPLDDRGLEVHWTAPADETVSGFVVEWFAVREKNSSILHWEGLNSSCRALVIREGIKPMERYAVSVNALYGDRGSGQSRTVHVYTRHGAPTAGPRVVVQHISGSRVDLTWSPVPVELLHGFVRNYTICYTRANQPARRVIVPGDALRYSLEDLSPGNYDIFMQASTDAGAGAAGPVVNVHIGSEEMSMVVYAVLPLTLSALVLTAFLAQNKKVKQTLCRDVPDPSNSSLVHWTPKNTLERLRQPAVAEMTEIRFSEVVLSDESDLQNSDPDQEVSYHSDLSNCYCLLPASEQQTPQNTEKQCGKSSPRDKMTCDMDHSSFSSFSSFSSISSSVLLSQMLRSLPTPLLHPSYIQSTDCSTGAINVVKLQLGGDAEPSLQDVSTTTSDLALSQTDELKTFCPASRPAEITSPQPFFF